jgi:hypothetical protein
MESPPRGRRLPSEVVVAEGLGGIFCDYAKAASALASRRSPYGGKMSKSKVPGIYIYEVKGEQVMRFHGDGGRGTPAWAEIKLTDVKDATKMSDFIAKVDAKIALNRGRES